MLRILYVDDDPDLLDICKIYLEDFGKFQVDTALSPGSALDALRVRPYDAVISDFQMPGMDGIAFYRELRKEHDGLPFILFTGRDHDELFLSAGRAGIEFFQRKGGDPDTQFTELACKVLLGVLTEKAGGIPVGRDTPGLDPSAGFGEYLALISPAGHFRFASDTDERYLGYSPNLLEGRNTLDFVHPEDADSVRQKRERILNNEETNLPLRLRFRTASGRYHLLESRWVDISGSRSIGGILVSSRDLGPCE
jgi:PAS domain S-box-containing protein